MRRTAMCLLPILAASLTIAACGGSSYNAGSSSKSSASSSAASSSTGGVVKTASNSTLGATVLTDASGMTLYRLSGEQGGKFICTGAGCLQIWHPLTASGTSVPGGSVSSLGTVKRPDGSEQVTYKGMPLYTFASDRQPGDAKGQGLKDVGTWNAVTVGAAPTTAAKSTPASESGSESASESAPTKAGGGYSY